MAALYQPLKRLATIVTPRWGFVLQLVSILTKLEKVIGRFLEGFAGGALNGGRIFHSEAGGGETLFGRSILHLETYRELYNVDYQPSAAALRSTHPRNLSGQGWSERSARSPFFAALQKPKNEEIENVII